MQRGLLLFWLGCQRDDPAFKTFPLGEADYWFRITIKIKGNDGDQIVNKRIRRLTNKDFFGTTKTNCNRNYVYRFTVYSQIFQREEFIVSLV